MEPDPRARLLLHLARFGSPSTRSTPPTEVVLHGGLEALVAAGVPPFEAQRLICLRAVDAWRSELEQCAVLGIRIALPEDDAFPPDLRGHPDAPVALWIAGAGVPAAPRVGIVGSRESTEAMERFARHLGRACAIAGLAVVSGLARGIDAAAHAGALEAHGRCVGVVGCGLDVKYPEGTWSLRRDVLKTGAVVSTYPRGTPAERFRFPERNRLIAALSAAIVVVQASAGSGALSTARAALEAGGLVLAVPGSVHDPLARGTNALIRDGAGPALGPRDVLEAVLGVGCVPPEALVPFDVPVDVPPADQPFVDAIMRGARTIEEIAGATGTSIAQVTERMVDLELDGIVVRRPGAAFRLRNGS